ncbi:MAG: TIM barrel protein [Phycisphaerae bacterium]|jgi:hydroxypyruvate isomerase|nr:TIM barrel protein [Phycisphaerae bacterium]MCZ2399144.1 TIM barrel protein [Phycisphaerae bacterium]
MNRREFIAGSLAATTAVAGAAQALGSPEARLAGAGARQAGPGPGRLKGRLKQSVCRWCYGKIPLEALCKAAAEIGLQSVELLGEKEWHVPAQHGLTCAVANGPNPIPIGWNRVENHDRFVAESERLLPLVKAAGIPNMIVFSGNRDGQPDAQGVRNCVRGLKRIMPLAESLGVTVVMELLSSKDHADYQCDRTAYGVEVVQGVSSPRFKLLYDIYHMQRMEGDVIATIRENIAHIGHFHTGGVPGRNEIDETQELNYATICKAIVELGYTGYLGQEFIPKRDPVTSLRQAAAICDA